MIKEQKRHPRFAAQKDATMKKLESAKKGHLVDKEAVPLIDYINSLAGFYTTSSCSGRIGIFCDLGSKRESSHAGKWHGKVSVEDVRGAIEKCACYGTVWFRCEPLIFHIVSADFEGAKKLIETAIKAGLKRSGVQVMKDGRFVVEVLGTDRVDAPIMDGGKMLVADDYIEYLVGIADKKFDINNKKLKRFEGVVRECF